MIDPSPHPSSPPEWAPRRRWGVLDFLIALVLLGTGIGTLPLLTAGPGKEARVLLEGKPVARLRLTGEARIITVAGKLGDMQLQYGESGVRVLSAPCPQQICVRQGWVKRSGSRIICLPSHIVVAVGGKAQDASAPDGVTF